MPDHEGGRRQPGQSARNGQATCPKFLTLPMSLRLSGRLLCVPSVHGSHFRRLETLRPPILRQSHISAVEEPESFTREVAAFLS